MDTILIVDDDPIVLKLMQQLLKGEGYDFVTAQNGKEAQTTIVDQKDRIAAILLDWAMPVMNGIELLRWTKSQPGLQFIPVIMETAMDRPQHIREGIDAGAFYYLTKPFAKEVLCSIVRAAVNDYRYKQELLRKLAESENPFRFMVDGAFRFNSLADAEYLAVRIANVCSEPHQVMPIFELFNNAVVHGNLGISYDETTSLIARHQLEAEVERRLRLPEFSSKYVEVKVHHEEKWIELTIQDQGAGFDFARYLTMDEGRVFDNHGRGIAITATYLDLQYFDNGSRVLVTIPLAAAERKS